MNKRGIATYNAPMFELMEVFVERGFAESYGKEGEAGQDMNITDQGSF